MRIAYVCADAGVPVFGTKGSSVHVQEMLGALLRTGAQIDLFAMRFDAELPASLAGVRVHMMPPAPKGPEAREAHCLAVNADLERQLGAAGPFDLIYERYSLWSHGALDAALASDTPYLLEVNAPLIDEQSEHRTLLRRADAEAIMHRQFAQASAVLAVSAEVAGYVRAAIGNPSDARVHIVPNGVNTERFRPGIARPADMPFTVGFVGTLKPWHGLETLIEAFALLHQRHGTARLLIVGDGPERATIEQNTLARGLLWPVRFTGAVLPEQVPALVTQFDVATAPYAQTEGFYFSPLKVYEYMAAGLPVVVSRVGQLATLIQDGENGVLCAPGDSAALADALLQLANDPALRQRLGAAARACVEREHTWDAVAQRVLNIGGE